MDFNIPWLTTRVVIYPRHWSCLLAPHWAMLFRSGKGTKVVIRKIPSLSWRRTDMIAPTTSTSWMTVVRTPPAALQRVPGCYPRRALQTRIDSWWIPGTPYWRANKRGCIKTLLLQSSVRSHRQRTQCLQWSSAWMQCVLTIKFFLTIWPPQWPLRSLRSEALTQTSQ